MLRSRWIVLRHHVRKYRTASYVYGHREKAKVDTKLVSHNRIQSEHPHLWNYIEYFRTHGFRFAQLDPLHESSTELHENLRPASSFQLDHVKQERFPVNGILHGVPSSDLDLEHIIDHLNTSYCGSIGAEFSHVLSADEREWMAEAVEDRFQRYPIVRSDRARIAQLLLQCQEVDRFFASKFGSVKRYGAEGAESSLVCFEQLFRGAAAAGVQQAVVGMPHRGRNNFMMVLLEYPPARYFRKMRGQSEFPPGEPFTGDTFSHYYHTCHLRYGDAAESVRVSLIPNPSHLEANIPVAAGKCRSKMQVLRDGDYNMKNSKARNGDKVVNILVHGDGSVAAQGIVAELLALAYTPHFCVGGSVHVILNNQLGFTTPSERGSSFENCSDVGKTIGCPVLHVNGEDPEEVYRAAHIAIDYRQRFRRDVIINLICYRRWGHNELDEPSFTNPLMYKNIRERTRLPDSYMDTLLSDEVQDNEKLMAPVQAWRQRLEDQLQEAESIPETDRYYRQDQWSHCVQPSVGELTVWDTGIDRELARYLLAQSVQIPSGFTLHPTLLRTHVKRRVERATRVDGRLDWAAAETLAVGSLLLEGHNVRLCGQDVGRGTFSHRHFMLVDQNTEAIHVPLNHMTTDQTNHLEVVNSALSEEAVFAFEVGMALDQPDNLVIWEAQFGDFVNGAQVLVDTYLGSTETKWAWQLGMVVILPHGMDGVGPEHSSCRVERFLQLTDSRECEPDDDTVNLYIVNPSTPAQYFHALRRQLARPFRKPLVIVTPKVLLRDPANSSDWNDFLPGTHFQHVIGDQELDPGAVDQVKQVVLCWGKHYYTLRAAREQLDPGTRAATALVRLDQLTPFPVHEIATELHRYPGAERIVWAQEEARNAGPWSFVSARLRAQLNLELEYAGRPELATPAVGIGELHKLEMAKLITDVFQQNK